MPSSAVNADPALQQRLSRFEQNRNAADFLEARTQMVDCEVRDAVLRHLPADSVAVCAVGGYGRRELFPYSDVDLLVVAESEEPLAALKQPLSEFLRVLWDRGLRVSHSARTVAECARLHDDNPELHISLLDRRFLAGAPHVWESFAARLTESFDRFRLPLSQKLLGMTRARHAKFNNTVFHLEPNVKETCGGIRDLHFVRWLAQLLPEKEVLEEAQLDLAAARQFLFAQRILLHAKAGRDANLLTFELQDQSARELPRAPKSPEDWMRLYFACARRVFQAAQRSLEIAETQDKSLASQFRQWRSRLSTPEFTVARERILLRNPAEILKSPDAILRLFTFSARHGLRLSWDTGRRITQALTPLRVAFETMPPAWTAWREFFCQPHAALALDEMQKSGVLVACLPPWETVESLVVRDFYHRYTVDEHTLVAIAAIDNLVNGLPETPARLRNLAEEEQQLPLLRLALLLHDIGKGTKPGDHVEGSLKTAPIVMARLGVPRAEQKSVLFLIEHHLALSLVMNGRDLEDPATARHLTGKIKTEDDLRRLTLLTYADISAVNPTAMTPWRLEQLWQVYLLGREQFTRELASFRFHRGDAVESLKSCSSELAGFLEGLPRRYLRTHSEEQIKRHFDMASFRKNGTVSVSVEAEAGFWLLTVLTRDRSGLFAALCGVLASFGMNILKGEAASNAAGVALDLIRFADPNRTLELNPEEINRLEWNVECVISGTLDVADLLKRRRPVRNIPSESVIQPSVRFSNDASDSATLIDFTAEDRPGLLYDLSSAISRSGCDIDVVLIDTEAHRAADVFYVTRNGCKLDAAAQEVLRLNLLKAADLSV